MIEKFDYYMGSTSYDGVNWVQRPTKKDFIDKINEIIDAIEKINEVLEISDKKENI